MHISERNYNNEVFKVFAECLRELKQLFIEYQYLNNDEEDNHISAFQALMLFQKLFQKRLAIENYQKLKDTIDDMIVIKKNNKKTVQIGIDIHKYIDFVLKVYMRYTPELLPRHVYIYNGWTLYDSSYITWKEFCSTVDIFADDEKIEITSDKRDKTGDILKGYLSVSEYKRLMKKKFGKSISIDKIRIDKDMLEDLTKDTNLFNNETANRIFFYSDFKGSTNDFKKWYYTCTDEEMFETMQKISITPLSKEVSNREKIIRMKNKVSKLEVCVDTVHPCVSYLGLVLLYLSYYKNSSY